MVSGRRAYVVALAAGALMSLAFPEPGLFFLTWFCIAPLLVVLRGAGAGRGFLIAFAFGLGYFGLLLHWITMIGFLAWGVLVPLQAAFVGAVGALWAPLAGRATAWQRVVMAALLWVLFAEALRSFTPVGGFTWGELAQSQTNFPHLLEAAGVAGRWGVAALLVGVNACLAEMMTTSDGGVRLRCVAAAAALLVLPVFVGTPDATGDAITVAIVQGNVPRDMEPSFEKSFAILQSHVRLTQEIRDDVDLVVWPESSVPFDPFRDEETRLLLADAARAVGAPVIVGADIDRDDNRRQVEAVLVGADGEIADRYQKTHLVPFGEYVPARDLLDWIPALEQVPRDAVPGREETLFEIAGNEVAPVISFEGDFGSLVQGRIKAGGRLLVVATNTSTWGDSWASAQHLAMSRLRAAETGVAVVHAALSGVSGFVAPGGALLERTELWTTDTLIRELRFAEGVTLYARTGDWFVVAALIGAAGITYSLRRRPNVTVT